MNEPIYAYLRTKGRRWPQILIKFVDGNWKSFSVRADELTAQEVLAIVRRQIALKTFNIESYLPRKHREMLLTDFLSQYFEHRTRELYQGRIKQNTFTGDRNAFKIFLKCFKNINHITVNDISKNDIDRFVNALINDGYKPGAINYYMRHLKHGFSWVVDEGIIKKSPFAKYSLLPDNNKEIIVAKKRLYPFLPAIFPS